MMENTRKTSILELVGGGETLTRSWMLRHCTGDELQQLLDEGLLAQVAFKNPKDVMSDDKYCITSAGKEFRRTH